MIPFHGLLQAIASAKTSRDIGTLVTQAVPGALDLTHPGLTFLGGAVAPREAYLDVPSRFAHDYERYGHAADPVVAAVVATHAPRVVAIDEILTEGRASEYGEFIARHRPRHSHSYLVAPVIVAGRLTGILQFVSRHEPERSRSALTALALHVSSRMSTLIVLEQGAVAHPDLTRRELEVADIAARGFTNAETGKALGISPNTVKKYLRAIYAKLSISTRAELGSLIARDQRD